MCAFAAYRFKGAGEAIRPGPVKFFQEQYSIHGGVEGYCVDQVFMSS
jgi:hypothetical protein